MKDVTKRIMNTELLRKLVDEQFQKMAKGQLFEVDIPTDEMWDTYLDSFPEGTNPIFRERREHDCNCCKNYIRNLGNVVSIVDGELVTIWDINVGNESQIIADTMANLIKSKQIRNVFLTQFNTIGTKSNPDTKNPNIIWTHFYSEVPDIHVIDKHSISSKLGEISSQRDVFYRALTEIDIDSINIVRELIAQDSIYRGQEHKGLVDAFLEHKVKFDSLDDKNKEYYTWLNNINVISGAIISFRNSVIGTLISDIASGIDLEDAVKRFESKVAPSNYKRPKALATPGMIKQAMKEWEEMGYSGAENRRYAVPSDLTINNILFVDRETKPKLSGFDELLAESEAKTLKSFNKLETVSIDKFLSDILPTAKSLEVFVENNHQTSLVSLIAPVDPNAKNMLKWKNNFTWSYNGEVTDAMKERVKTAGGSVDGVLRFSIQWNENGQDGSNDLDAHCKMPGYHIYYSSKNHKQSGGMLDVDITDPKSQTPKGIAVENITWPSIDKMPDGKYDFYVNNYSGRNTSGFRAQIEMDGEIHEFDYTQSIQENDNIKVGTVTLKNGNFTLNKHLNSTVSSKEIWGIKTNTFNKVNMVMYSPNYWDDEKIGNKHIFFILDGCKNPGSTRGFYNEFLNDDLRKHRKTMEMLSGKMLVEPSDEQLSGVGFSSTSKKSVIVKVHGVTTRKIKVQF